MRISDWSSDVCSSDLDLHWQIDGDACHVPGWHSHLGQRCFPYLFSLFRRHRASSGPRSRLAVICGAGRHLFCDGLYAARIALYRYWRSEEHTSELQSLMRISYAVFCLKKKKKKSNNIYKQT